MYNEVLTDCVLISWFRDVMGGGEGEGGRKGISTDRLCMHITIPPARLPQLFNVHSVHATTKKSWE